MIHDYYKSRTMNLQVKPIGFLDWPWFWRAIVAHPPLSVFNKALHWNPPPNILHPPIFNSALTSERSLGASLHSQTMAPKETWVSGMLHINYIMAQSDDSRPTSQPLMFVACAQFLVSLTMHMAAAALGSDIKTFCIT